MTLLIPQGTEPGVYQVRLNVTYREMTVRAEEESQALTASLRVARPPELVMTLIGPGSVEPGEPFTVTVVLRNSGEAELTVDGVEVSAYGASPVSQFWPAPGLIRPGGVARIEVDLVAQSEDVVVAVTARYSHLAGSSAVQETVRISGEAPEPRLYVEAEPTSLLPGSESRVRLVLRNSGDAEAGSVEVTLIPRAGLSLVGASRASVGDIPPGGEAELEVSLLPSEEAVSYWLDLAVRYSTERGERAENLSVGFSREEGAALDLLSVSAQREEEGLKVRGILVNLGNREAGSILVEVESGGCVGSTFLGDVGPGESAGFSVRCSGEPGDSVSVRVSYERRPGERVSLEGSAAVPAEEEAEAEATEGGGAGLEAVVLAGLLGFVLGGAVFRRRRG